MHTKNSNTNPSDFIKELISSLGTTVDTLSADEKIEYEALLEDMDDVFKSLNHKCHEHKNYQENQIQEKEKNDNPKTKCTSYQSKLKLGESILDATRELFVSTLVDYLFALTCIEAVRNADEEAIDTLAEAMETTDVKDMIIKDINKILTNIENSTDKFKSVAVNLIFSAIDLRKYEKDTEDNNKDEDENVDDNKHDLNDDNDENEDDIDSFFAGVLKAAFDAGEKTQKKDKTDTFMNESEKMFNKAAKEAREKRRKIIEKDYERDKSIVNAFVDAINSDMLKSIINIGRFIE